MRVNSEQRSSQIIKNVLMNWLALGATLLIGFLMSPFLVRHLGDAVYGVWILIGSLVGYLGLLDFGLTPSTVKYVAEYRARGDKEAINRVMTGGLAVFSLMGLLSLILSVVIAFYFNEIFDSPISRNTAGVIVILAGLNLALTFPSSVFVGMLRGYQRYDIDSIVTSIIIAARSLLLVVLIMRGYGIIALAITTFTSDMIRLAYLVRWAYRLNPDIRISREYLDRAELRRLFVYSIYFFLIGIGRQVIFYTDSIVIGVFLTASLVTVYFIAGRLVTYLRYLVLEMVGVLAPTTSDLDARNDHAGIRELLVVSTKYTLLIGLPAAAVFFVMGDIFISLWMGPGYESSALILSILTAASLAELIVMPSNTILLGLGKHRIVAVLTVWQAFANLALTIILVKPFGIAGVAYGTLIPMVANALVAFPLYFHNYLRFPLGDYLRRSMVLPLVIQAPFVSALVLLKTYSPASSFLVFFSQIAIALIPYSALALLICISPSERRAFLRIAEKFGLKLAPRFS